MLDRSGGRCVIFSSSPPDQNTVRFFFFFSLDPPFPASFTPSELSTFARWIFPRFPPALSFSPHPPRNPFPLLSFIIFCFARVSPFFFLCRSFWITFLMLLPQYSVAPYISPTVFDFRLAVFFSSAHLMSFTFFPLPPVVTFDFFNNPTAFIDCSYYFLPSLFFFVFFFFF